MEKMWAGRFLKASDKRADDFNSSIHFDSRMYRQDIQGSMAHAAMLAAQGILTQDDCDAITAGLEGILNDLDSGALAVDMEAEDIHMFVEAELTKRIGDTGKRLHTARSRNDQVAVDLRMYLRDEVKEIIDGVYGLIEAVAQQAEANTDAILPGYTHLQRAQPVTFAHHLLAYAMMLMRDVSRLQDASERMNVCPLGSCALAGTTYETDRGFTAQKLGFDSYCLNSIDGVSDRDFCVEILSALSILMMHLSRFAEEVILWSSWEFKFVELDDAYTTGSSIMPQKKNPDMAELIRGKTGRVYGDLMTLLTVMKGLPLAYNKDMQEDKECAFDAADTLKACLEVMNGMLKTAEWNKERLRAGAGLGFTNATDAADYFVKNGMAFRDAHAVVGHLVLYCEQHGKAIDELSLDEIRQFAPDAREDIYDAISLETCVNTRSVPGGPAPDMVREHIRQAKMLLGDL